ncbi:AhpC/TSA family protein [Labilibacter sediminis]|nr:AhpC/TSA family protein [Labilibacter sediminis]
MKNLFLVAVLAIALFSCQQKNFKISGTVENLTEGEVILKKIVANAPVSLDTAQIVEGKFTFTGSEDEAQLYLIFIDDNRMPVVFFGENKNIDITVNTENMGDAVISGSPVTDIYTAFVKEVPGKDKMESIQAEYQQAMSAGDQDKMTAIREEVSELMEEQKAYFIQFVKDNTTNVVGANMAMQAANEFEFEEFKALVGKFEASLGEHMYVKELKKVLEPLEKAAAAEKATEIGQVAPDFTLESVSGESLALSSLKGKYVLVDFWASWCKPCREENPNVVKAYNDFSAKGFDVLGVSLDRDSAAWKQAIKDDGLVWNQVIDGNGDIASTYGVSGIPFTLLLDKEGKIVAKNLRGEALTNKLAELLN